MKTHGRQVSDRSQAYLGKQGGGSSLHSGLLILQALHSCNAFFSSIVSSLWFFTSSFSFLKASISSWRVAICIQNNQALKAIPVKPEHGTLLFYQKSEYLCLDEFCSIIRVTNNGVNGVVVLDWLLSRSKLPKLTLVVRLRTTGTEMTPPFILSNLLSIWSSHSIFHPSTIWAFTDSSWKVVAKKSHVAPSSYLDGKRLGSPGCFWKEFLLD